MRGRLRSWGAGFTWLVGFLAAAASSSSAVSAERKYLGDGAGVPLSQQSDAGERLSPLQRKALNEKSVRIIVGLAVPFAAEGDLTPAIAGRQRKEISDAAESLKKKVSARFPQRQGVINAFKTTPYVSLAVTPEELQYLASQPEVISIEEDRLDPPLLAESTPLVGASSAWSSGSTGSGQTIAILDTGVDKAHAFLTGKVVSEACYSLGGLCPGGAITSTASGSGVNCTSYNGLSLSSCDHGTHVAGIVAGSGSSFSGVAKSAKLIAIQVFSPTNCSTTSCGLGAYVSDQIKALERVYDLRTNYAISSVNMSLGGGTFKTSCDSDSRKAIVDNLRSAGIATVVAAGNDGFTDAISSPACISSTISVGATWDTSGWTCGGAATAVDQVACYSNSSSLVRLLAPGSAISSSVPGNQYAVKHGTSMATPHVAGAWAVVQGKAPNATVSDILAAFQKTGRPVTDTRNAIVKPRIDIALALGEFAAAPSSYSLSVSRAGTGSGAVTSAPTGINCGDVCSFNFPTETTVALTATPTTGSTFVGWSGACSGNAGCLVTLTQASSVGATFNTATQSYQLTVSTSGAGTVGSADGKINCGVTCTTTYAAGTSVTLTATPAFRKKFVGWTGACTGLTNPCTLVINGAASTKASFK